MRREGADHGLGAAVQLPTWQLPTATLDEPVEVPGAAPLPAMALGARFRLVRELGAGATGTVFEAIDGSVGDHRVALKVLTCLRPHALYHFKQEFRSVAQIVHPNLVGIHELLVCESGHLCLVMDLIDGAPLVAALRARDPDCGALTRSALTEVVLGLQALHDHGIVHRDLKPANVLLSTSDTVSIVDFGLALTWSARGAAHGGFYGTPAYAAPEQLAGLPTGPAADWYAVGVMLYELLWARRPPAASSRARRLAPPVRSARSPFQAALSEVCLAMLAPAAHERAAGADLLAALAGGRRSTRRASPPAAELVGREAELARLRSTFARVASGAPAIALLRGDPGIGKTLLAETFAARLVAAGEAQLLRGRCHAHEGIPYRAIDSLIDALGDLLEQLPPARTAAALQDDSRALLTLFPALRRALPPGARPWAQARPCAQAERADAAMRVRAADELRRVLGALSSAKPLVLWIDDLHWGDADSGALLLDLFAHPHPPPVLLLAAYRGEDTDDMAALAALLGHPASASFVEHIEVPPLPEAYCAVLARALGVDEQLAIALAREAAGNPSSLRELAQEARSAEVEASDPSRAGRSARWAALGADEQAVLRILSAAGRPVRRALLARIDARATHAVLRKLDWARFTREYVVRGELQVELHEPRRWRAFEAASEASSRAVHGRLADAALGLGAAYAEAAVEHLLLAGREREAARPALLAAERAARVLAFHRQAQLLSHALRHAPEQERWQVCVECAEAYARAGCALQAAEHYERAARARPSQDSFELLCRALALYILGGRTRRGIALAEELRRDLVDGRDAPGDARGPIGGAAKALAAFRVAVRSPFARRSAPGVRHRLRLLVSLALATGHVRPSLALRCWFHVLFLARAQGDALAFEQAAGTLANAVVLALGRSVPAFEARLERALADRRAPADHRAFLGFLRGMLRGSSVRHAAALEDLLPVAGYAGEPTPMALAARSYARVAALSALFFTGRLRQLGELSRQWTLEARRAGDLYAQVALCFPGLFQFLRVDDVESAREQLRRARAVSFDVDPASIVEPWWEVWFHLYGDDPESALRVCEQSRARWHKSKWLIRDYRAAHRFAIASVWASLAGSCRASSHAREQLAKHTARLRRQRGCRDAPLTLHLVATQAHLHGRRAEAVRALAAAATVHEAQGHRLFAACAHARLSLLGAGRDHRWRADQYFREEGIVQTERWVDMLIPGFGSS